MIINDAVTAVYLKSTGKATAPSASKRAKIIGLLNFYQRRWAREPGVDWNSLYVPNFSLGSITATDTYDIDISSIRKLSDREGDSVRVVWSNGIGYTDFDIVPADSLKDYYFGPLKTSYKGNVCARIGSTLVFNRKFASTDAEYGGDIQVPCYTLPDDITDASPASDEVQVDDPDWLVLRCASDYVRTDITRQGQAPFLLSEANEVMGRMKDDNDAQIEVVNKPWTPQSGLIGDMYWG